MDHSSKKETQCTHCKEPKDLWSILTKVRGLAALFRMSNGEVPMGEESCHGISYLLDDIADELDCVRDMVEYGEG